MTLAISNVPEGTKHLRFAIGGGEGHLGIISDDDDDALLDDVTSLPYLMPVDNLDSK